MTALLDPLESSEGTPPRSRWRRSSWWPITTVGYIAAGLALLLPLFSVRITDYPALTGRYALLSIEAAIGLPLAAVLLRLTRHRAATFAALAFLAVAAVSTIISDNPAMSFWGTFPSGVGLLFAFGAVGAWMLGVAAGRRHAAAVERALLIGLAVNVPVVFLQVFVDLRRLGLPSLRDQPTGLFGQPVHLGAFLLGGLWLVTRRASGSPSWMWLAVVAVATSIELTAERGPFLLSFVVAVVVARRRSVRLRVTVLGLVLVGLLLGGAIARVGAQTHTAAGRLTASSGDGGRLENYKGAIEAIGERPLLGWGPGRYMAGTSPHRTRALAATQPDSYFVDAHNWPLHWAVTTGVLGAGALLAWIGLASRHACGPLAGFAVCIGLIGLIQPQNETVTVLALLTLGVASAGPSAGGRAPRWLHVPAMLIATAIASTVFLTGWRSERGSSGSSSEAVAAASVPPSWPERAERAARAILADDNMSAADRATEASRWADAIVARDGRDPRFISTAAYIKLVVAQENEAETLFHRVLKLDPFSALAKSGLGVIAINRGDRAEGIALLEEAQAIVPTDRRIAELLDAARSSGD